MVDLKGNLMHKDEELKRNEDRFKQKIIDTEKSNKEMGEEIIKLRNELELQRAAMHKTTLTTHR